MHERGDAFRDSYLVRFGSETNARRRAPLLWLGARAAAARGWKAPIAASDEHARADMADFAMPGIQACRNCFVTKVLRSRQVAA